MKRSDFFRGMWLSPLALVRAPETPPNSPSTVGARREARRDVQRDAAVATTGDVFDVKDYGARGDGTTDDTAAIRAAATAAIGGVLFFSPGTYLLTDQITIGDGASFSTVQAHGAVLNWTAFGGELAETTPARAATGNGVRMLSHTGWYGGKLTMTNVGSPLNVSIPAINFSGAFRNVFAIGHFNNSTTASAVFATFTENVRIADVDFDLVAGGSSSFIFIAGATRQVRCSNLRMTKTSTDNADRVRRP